MNKVLPSDHGDDSTHGSTGFNLQGLTGKGKIEVLSKGSTGTITSQYLYDYLIIFIIDGGNLSTTVGGSTSSVTHMITNGICSFSPTSTKGKWIFLIQTVILSFTPITILLVQNGTAFYDLMQEKEGIIHKNKLVRRKMIHYEFLLDNNIRLWKYTYTIFLIPLNVRLWMRWVFLVFQWHYNGNVQLYP